MQITDTFQTTGGTTHELHLTLADCAAIIDAADTLFPWLVAPAVSTAKHSTYGACSVDAPRSRWAMDRVVLRMDRVSARDTASLQAICG